MDESDSSLSFALAFEQKGLAAGWAPPGAMNFGLCTVGPEGLWMVLPFETFCVFGLVSKSTGGITSSGMVARVGHVGLIITS